MKKSILSITILLMLGLSFCLYDSPILTAYASESGNVLLEQIENALEVEVFYQEETTHIIKCFDVNESGSYAIGFRNNTIHVYDPLGKFQYGYRFHTEGTYGISLKENSIVIYLGRSGIAAEIDSAGRCINAENVIFTKAFNENVMDRTHKQIGKVNYSLERDIGVFSGFFSRLVKMDENDVRTVLYDATSRAYLHGVIEYLVLISFSIGVISVFVTKVIIPSRRINSDE